MDDEEMQQIRRAVDESKQQFVINHGDEQRRMRESAIAARSSALLQDGKQYMASALPGAEPKKQVAGAPKGIPMTMIVSQPTDQDGVPYHLTPSWCCCCCVWALHSQTILGNACRGPCSIHSWGTSGA